MIQSSSGAPGNITSKISMLSIPRDKLVVITGVSGSGKSSLAFDTIYAEGQRRYVESLVRLCPPVSGSHGKARCRLHRRLEPGHFHRPEGQRAQSAFDRRHRHRDLRLSAFALRAGGTSPLPPVRPGDCGADRRADCRCRQISAERYAGFRFWPRSSKTARASTSPFSTTCESRLCPGPGGRQITRPC